MEFVGVNNTYAESATPDQLMEKYELTAPFIVRAVKKVLKKEVGGPATRNKVAFSDRQSALNQTQRAAKNSLFRLVDFRRSARRTSEGE